MGRFRPRWLSRERVAGLLGALVLVAGFAGAVAAKVASASSTPAVGVYTGYGDVSGAQGFASTTGADVTIAADYQDGSSWAGIDSENPAWEWRGSGYQLALGVPMLPTGATLADGAAGDYNSYFQTLAENLVNAGAGNAILHIGWEWDQGSCTWCVNDATDAANFAAFWRQIVTTMRSVSGADFNYSWYYGDGGDSLTQEAWPGASYVSSIDNDFYDQSWDTGCGLAFNNTSTPAESECAWNNDALPGLNGLAAFDAQYGEPIGFGEWGVISRSDGHGLGDDPTFVNNFAAWIDSHDVEYADYFDFNSGGDSVLTDFPNSLAAFQHDLG